MSHPTCLPDRYTKHRGEVSARLRRGSEEPELRIGRASAASFLATREQTNGEFGLYRWDMGPVPAGPAAHFHRSISESFFVLSGTVRLFDGEKWIAANPGDFLYVPPGGIHAFRNDSGAPASMLLLFAPGAPREPYFQVLADAAATGRAITPEEVAQLWLEHDTYPV